MRGRVAPRRSTCRRPCWRAATPDRWRRVTRHQPRQRSWHRPSRRSPCPTTSPTLRRWKTPTSATARYSTEPSISLLPRRRPGSSGITGAPDAPPDRDQPPAVAQQEARRADPGTACRTTGFEHFVILRLAGPIHQRRPPATEGRAARPSGRVPAARVPAARVPVTPRSMTSGLPKLPRRRPSRPRTI